MDPMRDDREPDRLESTWDRWQGLPLASRSNACLYGLPFIALVGLLAQVVSGDGNTPRRVDVASQAPPTTRPKPTTTTAPPASTLPLSLPTTAPVPKAVPSAAASPATTRASVGAGASQPADTTPIPGLPLPPPNCQNSSDPACGDFSWSPPASKDL